MRWLVLVVAVLGLIVVVVRNRGAPKAAEPLPGEARSKERAEMVASQISNRGIRDENVLTAMSTVPRHLFVPSSRRIYAYEDRPLPIGKEQTISQPYIVALMSELAQVEPGSKVLEVGTGSGYQAAVLSAMGVRVFTIEIVEALAKRAEQDLKEAGYTLIQVRAGDGYRGWPEEAPFDAIIVTAAPDHVPQPLKEQLKVGGRLVLPVGDEQQVLMVFTRTESGWDEERVVPVMFVPMTGEAEGK